MRMEVHFERERLVWIVVALLCGTFEGVCFGFYTSER